MIKSPKSTLRKTIEKKKSPAKYFEIEDDSAEASRPTLNLPNILSVSNNKSVTLSVSEKS